MTNKPLTDRALASDDKFRTAARLTPRALALAADIDRETVNTAAAKAAHRAAYLCLFKALPPPALTTPVARGPAPVLTFIVFGEERVAAQAALKQASAALNDAENLLRSAEKLYFESLGFFEDTLRAKARLESEASPL
jgi:hypothetical protein